MRIPRCRWQVPIGRSYSQAVLKKKLTETLNFFYMGNEPLKETLEINPPVISARDSKLNSLAMPRHGLDLAAD